MSQGNVRLTIQNPVQRLGILLGVNGSGKTTLLQLLITHSRISITHVIKNYRVFWRFIQQFFYLYSRSHQDFKISKCRYKDQAFEIMDTRGLKQYDNHYEYMNQQRLFFDCLHDQYVSRLFIVCKYDRVSNIINNIDKIFMPLQNYQQLMTVIITHWDQCQNQTANQSRIQTAIEEDYGIRSVIFTGSDNINLAQSIYKAFDEDQTKINLENTLFDIKVDGEILSNLRQQFSQQQDIKNQPDNEIRVTVDRAISQTSPIWDTRKDFNFRCCLI